MRSSQYVQRNHSVVVQKANRVGAVSHDAANLRRANKHVVILVAKHYAYLRLHPKISVKRHDVIAFSFQGSGDSPANHAFVPQYKYVIHSTLYVLK
jgi:hypothetical protein